MYPLLWYLLILILGWLVFPLAYRFLPALADRGYTVSRALGLLLWGYIFWLLASLGILHNDPAGLLMAWIILAILTGWILRQVGPRQIWDWLRQQRRMVFTVEALFLIAFVTLTVLRAANPEAAGTEKPMELAFINAILASPTFPPHDPWLSGYAISYYHFGYILVAMLAQVTGTPGGIAFNLGLITVFAMSAVGTYGLVYNLLAAYKRQSSDQPAPNFSLTALLGPLFVLIVSNLEGFLHVLHTRGLFWQQDAMNLVSPFWRWLDIKDLDSPPTSPFTWIPTRFWWWWRASRVVQDYNLAGNAKEIIDEFPFFSYLLGDLHPHVLVMPFTFLVLALTLNVFLGGSSGTLLALQRRFNLRTLAWAGTLAIPLGILMAGSGLVALRLSLLVLGIGLLAIGLVLLVRLRHTLLEYGIEILLRSDLGDMTIGAPLHIHPPGFLLAAVILGGMAFLNIWDFPFYVALFAAAYALQCAYADYRPIYTAVTHALTDFIWIGLALGLSGGLLYLPFYLGFSSQAGGILPNLISPTRGAHLWIMFAPLLLPLFAFLIYLARQSRNRKYTLLGLRLALGFILILGLAALLMGLAILTIPNASALYTSTLGTPDHTVLLFQAFSRRIANVGSLLTLVALLTLTLGALLRIDDDPEYARDKGYGIGDAEDTDTPISHDPCPRSTPPAHAFALLLILFGTLFVLGPEFFYLIDQFGWRMNTIFKFYFQAWLLWGIAAAYASAVLLSSLRRTAGTAFSLGWLIILACSLVYPILSPWSKANEFKSFEWSLDSTAYLRRQAPDEMLVIDWLRQAPAGVVAEAVPADGGSYSDSARVSMLSGQPTVLGWIGHESQWRGGGQAMGSRQSDLERLYCTRDWKEAQAILERYNIRYVFIGALERATYRASQTCHAGLVESKFTRYLQIVSQFGQATLYEYSAP